MALGNSRGKDRYIQSQGLWEFEVVVVIPAVMVN
ncbi:MAG: hypothetical protein Ct9H90mP16_05500 [Candidatus Poseidoniales archaeon]|nr:MAG: hypothetical protein Ct9H90mP16_05500 [Candidatus Poseidoniales archaeon]